MLSLLLEAALRSLLLGAIVWFGLKLLRVRDPRAHMTAWIVVLIASLTMPVMMHWMVVTLPTAAPPLRIVALIEAAPNSLLPPTVVPADAVATSVAPPVGMKSHDGPVAPIAIVHAADWVAIATGIYVTVAGVLLLRLLVGIVLTWRLTRAARPIGEGWAPNLRVSDVDVPRVGAVTPAPRAQARGAFSGRQGRLSSRALPALPDRPYVLRVRS
jgi:hypothetical protein